MNTPSLLSFSIGYIQQLLAFKSSNPNLKVSAAIGGWNDALVPVWSIVAANAGARSNFASNILQFIQKNGLDGIGRT
jgi:GH18 family chitinase